MNRILFIVFPVFLLAMAAATVQPKLYVIGDSTACVYDASLYPRTGWAQILQEFFISDSVQIVDKAISGRSSKSFYDEGHWTPVKSALRQGDYVIIQFGHNDEKTSDAARGTVPASTFKYYLSIYVDDAIAKGAIPILATPIERNKWSSGTVLQSSHITSDGDYPQAIRDLAAEKNVALIDATILTKSFFEKIGMDSTTKLFMNLSAGEWPNYPGGNSDNTHLQERGAREVSQLIVDDIAGREMLPLANCIKRETTAVEQHGTSFTGKYGMTGTQTIKTVNRYRSAVWCDLQGRSTIIPGRISGYGIGIFNGNAVEKARFQTKLTVH